VLARHAAVTFPAMDSLKALLFENPLKLYLLLAVAEVVVAAFWYSRRTRRWGLGMLVPVLLAVVVALTAHLVMTDREQIAAALKAIAASAEAGDLSAAAGYLDADCVGAGYRGSRLEREELILLGQQALRKYPVQTVRLSNVETKIAGANATTTLNTHVTFRSGERYRLDWKVQWAKRPAGWRIVAVELPAAVSAI
jgi:hypothetical protein